MLWVGGRAPRPPPLDGDRNGNPDGNVMRRDNVEDVYRLVWTYHRLILDGWSVGALLQEAGALYAAFAAGRARAPETRRPFRDYVAWLRAQGLAEAEGYWRSRLADFTAPTPLGVDT